MRIAVVTTWYPHHRDVLEGSFVRDQVEALRAAGHDVEVFHRRVSGPRMLTRGAYLLALWPRLTARHRAQRFDVVHAHGVLPAGLVAMAFSKWAGVPFVLTEHASPFGLNLRGLLDRDLTARVLQAAHVIAAPSTRAAEAIQAFRGYEIRVVPNVVPDAFYDLGEPAIRVTHDDVRFLVLGRFCEQKSTDLIVKALDLMPDKGWQCVFVGSGPLEGLVREAQSKRGNVWMAGEIPTSWQRGREVAQEWIRWCDVLLSPSRHESFGLNVAEAAAAGRPVIVTPEHPLYNEPGVMAAPVRLTPDSIATYMRMLIENGTGQSGIRPGQWAPRRWIRVMHEAYNAAIARHWELYNRGDVRVMTEGS